MALWNASTTRYLAGEQEGLKQTKERYEVADREGC